MTDPKHPVGMIMGICKGCRTRRPLNPSTGACATCAYRERVDMKEAGLETKRMNKVNPPANLKEVVNPEANLNG